VEEIKKLSKKEALAAAMKLCSKEEKCTHDILIKFRNWDLSEDELKEMIEYLKTNKFIDETRYVIAFTKDKFSFFHWGKIKIEHELKQKKIPADIIRKGLDMIDEKEYKNRIKEEMIKKLKSIHSRSDYEIKGKLYRFAAGKGFESDIIYSVLDEIIDSEK
jgi:regulatory protein